MFWYQRTDMESKQSSQEGITTAIGNNSAPGKVHVGVPTWCSGAHSTCAGSGSESPDHAHSLHSVFAKRCLITRPRAFCCWKTFVSVHWIQHGKHNLIASHSISFGIVLAKAVTVISVWWVELLWKLQVYAFCWWIFMTQAICTRQTSWPFLSLPCYSSSSWAEWYIWCANNTLILKWKLDNVCA